MVSLRATSLAVGSLLVLCAGIIHGDEAKSRLWDA